VSGDGIARRRRHYFTYTLIYKEFTIVYESKDS